MVVKNFFNADFLKRTLSSIFLIFIAVSFNYLGGLYFLFLLLIIQMVLVYEYNKILNINTKSVSLLFSYLILVICSTLAFFDYFYQIIVPFLLAISISSILSRKNFLAIAFSYIYILIPALILIYLNNFATNGKVLILLAFIIVWSADVSAYFFGNLIRGPKLIKKLSPKKTWSGFISSVVFAGIASLTFSYLYDFENKNFYLFLGLVTGVFVTLGDLFESYLKRINLKKDSSNLIPGHGGVLDRLDGFLIAIVIYWLLTFIWE